MDAAEIETWLGFYVVLAVLASLYGSHSMQMELSATQPAARSFRWGFYNACMGMACLPLSALAVVATINCSLHAYWTSVVTDWLMAFFLALHSICGCFIFRRKKWAWIAGTLLSFNLIVWIINFYYGKKRWREFT